MFSTWHIIRAAGLTSYVLLFLITVWGLLLSTRIIPSTYRPPVLSIHQTAVTACIFFTAIHAATLLLDKHVNFSLADVLLPFRPEDTAGGTTTGILAFYAILMVTITSVPIIMRMLGARLWRYAHYFALPCFWLALYHSIRLGSDSNSPFVILLYKVTACVVLLIMLLRAGMLMRKRGIADEHSACGR